MPFGLCSRRRQNYQRHDVKKFPVADVDAYDDYGWVQLVVIGGTKNNRFLNYSMFMEAIKTGTNIVPFLLVTV